MTQNFLDYAEIETGDFRLKKSYVEIQNLNYDLMQNY